MFEINSFFQVLMICIKSPSKFIVLQTIFYVELWQLCYMNKMRIKFASCDTDVKNHSYEAPHSLTYRYIANKYVK